MNFKFMELNFEKVGNRSQKVILPPIHSINPFHILILEKVLLKFHFDKSNKI